MADVTKTIGTAGRDYSTVTLWEAGITNTTYSSAGTTAIGEAYDDSAFDEAVTMSWSASNVTLLRLTVATGERHNGTAGTGVRQVSSTLRLWRMDQLDEWLWWEYNGNDHALGSGVDVINIGGSNAADYWIARQLIIHDVNHDVTGGDRTILTLNGADSHDFCNCFAYNLTGTSSGSFIGVTGGGVGGRVSVIQNISVHKTTNNSTGATAGIYNSDAGGQVIRNCISTSTTSSGSAFDIYPASPASATYTHNVTSDTSSSGTGSTDSIAASSLFVSTTGGSEDLHLKTGADASVIDTGSDRGTSPSGIQFDIDNYDRDTAAVAWDIGADEFVAAAGAAGHGEGYVIITS